MQNQCPLRVRKKDVCIKRFNVITGSIISFSLLCTGVFFKCLCDEQERFWDSYNKDLKKASKEQISHVQSCDSVAYLFLWVVLDCFVFFVVHIIAQIIIKTELQIELLWM